MKIRAGLVKTILSFWVLAAALCSSGQIAPTDPPVVRPAPEWLPPPRPADAPGSTLPQDPATREIEPLEVRQDPSPAPPAPLTSKGSLPPPEEPPSSQIEVDWEAIFSRTMRPVVLPTQEYVAIQGNGTALREGPGIDFPVVGTVAEAEVVPLRDSDDDWHRVELAGGGQGWVYSGFTSPVAQTPAVLIGEKVNLRQSPNPESAVLDTLYQGSVVLSGFEAEGWTEVRTPSVGSAFVTSFFVKQLPAGYPINPALAPYPLEPPVVASLANLSEDASGTSSYMLAVWGNEWVKGGKVGLVYFSNIDPSSSLGGAHAKPAFLEGVFFQATVLREDWRKAFAAPVTFPPNAHATTVGYLRGTKKDLVWTFEFTFQGLDPEGRFALVCQEGAHTGTYLLLEERIID
jgi:SH3-like domain-containing protein